MEAFDIEKAQHALETFMSEMNAWETRAFPARATISTPEGRPIVAELRRIYDRWLVKKDRTLGGELTVANVGFPPEYDPEFETVVAREAR